MPYVFAEHLYPGVPRLHLHSIAHYQAFSIGDIPVMPIRVMHDKLPITAFRFGSLAYITDMKSIDDKGVEALAGIETLVVNALRFSPDHHSHMLVDDAVAFARRTGARQTFFTHCTHDIGLHDDANARLPEGFMFAFDGMKVSIGSPPPYPISPSTIPIPET